MAVQAGRSTSSPAVVVVVVEEEVRSDIILYSPQTSMATSWVDRRSWLAWKRREKSGRKAGCLEAIDRSRLVRFLELRAKKTASFCRALDREKERKTKKDLVERDSFVCSVCFVKILKYYVAFDCLYLLLLLRSAYLPFFFPETLTLT